MAKFTSGHINSIAGVLARARLSPRDHAEIVASFSRIFARSNPEFLPEKFARACSQGNALTIAHTQFEHT